MPGRIWIAGSNLHNLPAWSATWTAVSGVWARGGIVRSDDHGSTFTATSNGLPTDTYPVLDVLVDPTSSLAGRRLYAATYGGGAYRSTDGGAHWNAWNDGLEPANLCAVHVRRDNAGKLYLITGLRATIGARG